MTRKLLRRDDTYTRSSRLLRIQHHIRRCCEYAMKDVPKIMEYLSIKDWCLGGSVAGILYGCDFNRVPHDIDIIIPEGSLTKELIDFINDSPLVEVLTAGKYSGENDSKNITINTVRGYPIDLVENRIGEQLTSIQFTEKVKVSSPASLLASKSLYSREKDKNDLIELQKLVDRLK